MPQDDPIAEFMALPEAKQMDMLRQLPRANQDRLLVQVRQRRTQAAPRSAPLAPSLDRTVGNYATEIAKGVGRGVKNDVVGLYTTLRHPYDTAKGLVTQTKDAAKASRDAYRSNQGAAPITSAALAALDHAPMIGGMVQRAEQGDGYGSPESFGAAAEGMTSIAAPELAGRAIRLAPRIARDVTGTGVGVVKDLAESTAETNAKLVSDRAAELKNHFVKTKAAREAEQGRSAIASRKEAMESGVRKLSDRFQGDLKTARDKAAQEADLKYKVLDASLGDIPANTETLHDALSKAAENIKGSDTEPSIFHDIQKRLARGGDFNYSDLQGYYSEAGRELQKGNLPGDVYTAYNTLQDSISEEMQRIAEGQGLGDRMTDARSSWRNLKQTFYDPKSPLRKALQAKEPGVAVRQLVGKDRTAIEAIAKYDPELAKRANVLRGYDVESRNIRVPADKPKASPVLSPRPELRTLGPEDVRAAKANALADRARGIRTNRLGHVASVGAVFDVMRNLAQRNVRGVGLDIAARGGLAAAQYGVARVLENPTVIDFLSKATPKDIEAIPPDLRGDFPNIVRAATKQGDKVSPALRATFYAAVLAPRNPERHPTDAWAGPQQ